MKYYVVLFFCIVWMFGVTGCGTMETVSSEETSKDSTLHLVEEDTFENYTLEQAKEEGCLVHEDGEVTHGKKKWSRFVEDANAGKAVSIRLVFYYTLGDASLYEPEYYETIKDEYPQLCVSDLIFDGKEYTYYDYSDGIPCVSKYKYLMKYEGEEESEYATFDSYVRYVLTNDNTVTWDDIWRGMVSSVNGEYINHCSVYTEYISDVTVQP